MHVNRKISTIYTLFKKKLIQDIPVYFTDEILLKKYL